MGQRLTFRITRTMRDQAHVTIDVTEKELDADGMDEIEYRAICKASEHNLWENITELSMRCDVLQRGRISDWQIPVASGFSEWKPRKGDPGGRLWAVLGPWATDVEDEDILHVLNKMGEWGFQDEHGAGWAGQSFAEKPRVARRTMTRVLITQRVGWDI